MTVNPEQFLSESQRIAMQTAKQCYHKILADGGLEGEAAVAMAGQAVNAFTGIDRFTSCRVGLHLLARVAEVLADIAIEDAKREGRPLDGLIAARDNAIAVRIASEAQAQTLVERPKPTLVPDNPAND